ncbi:MAG TPA: methyltransferase domain-containing protein [Geminicoccaceae bacterium]|jgi:ubiquinone/menaquinone biosynthesis C-methylase UbiE|nr:methyltransferase domain-containing protein [Geminicoccaceae bacterium]
MSVLESTFLRMFGRPTGMLGKLGGVIMARMNAPFAHCVIRLLDIQPGDKVLEIGLGPGVGIQLLAKSAPGGRVAGLDCSREMVKQATARNAEAIERGVVDLRHGSVEKLPFEDSTFDAVVAINSMQVWPDVTAGLREVGRVTRSGGRVALGFTPYSGRSRAGIPELLSAAGFADASVVETKRGFCALALKP